MDGYDHRSEWEQGRADALQGLPRRLSQTALYRQGYDRGLSEALRVAASLPGYRCV